MSLMNLIDLVFKRVCEIASMCGLVIKELPSGEVNFRIINDDRSYWNPWKWENKEQFLLGNQFNISLFNFIADGYMPYYYYLCLNHKRYASFIDLCKTLRSCECIEELALKMDMIGI